MATYDKIFDILLMLRDTREHFQTYSASDIKKLIASKRKLALKRLYKLESMITDLRESLIIEDDHASASLLLLTSSLCPPAVD
jgi:hypothetical protein